MLGRRWNTAILTALLVTASLSPLAAQEWAGKGRAQGLVKDEAGNPLEGAKVTLRFPAAEPRGGPEPIFTNKRGRWSTLGLLGGNWQVLIELQGFLISEGVYYVNEFQPSPPVEVTLTRDPSASIDVGEALLEAGSYAEARAAYLQALDGMDELGRARLRTRIGDTYLAEGQAAAARAEYEQALPVIPPEEQTHVRLQIANSYQTEGDYPAAREFYEAVLPGLPAEGQAQVLQTIAQGYGAEGNNAAAIAALERANGLAPGNPAVLQLLVDLLMREGRESDAEAYLAQLPADMTLPTDMVLNMGIRLYNEGNMDEALGYFERAVAEHPEEPEAYYYRGLSYLSQGRNDEARGDFHKLLELDPDTSHRQEVEEFLQFLEQGS
jgi:tetratricopeptide (TPR) repeat protein